MADVADDNLAATSMAWHTTVFRRCHGLANRPCQAEKNGPIPGATVPMDRMREQLAMTRYVALLRAVNVGGTGKLPMADLRALAVDAGFTEVRTYITSGNLVFSSRASTASVKEALEDRLQAYAGKPVTVFVRTAAEMRAVLASNPFPDSEPKYTLVTFLDAPAPDDALDKVAGRADEEIHLGKREITIHYPCGVSRSKLKVPAANSGTARNFNTVAKLVEMVTGT